MQKKFIVKTLGASGHYGSVDEIEIGDKVVVDNGGLFVGSVCNIVKNDGSAELPMILRKASDEDLKTNEANAPRAKDALARTKDICRKHNKEMKLLGAQFSLGGEKILLAFSSENRVDFRDLVKELAGALKARVELKQVGLRDEAKIIGGLGPCGLPCCCSRIFDEPPFTSIKMAKTQSLSLSPHKINGLCGKIMCCVSYENDHYVQTLKEMPKMNQRVKTPDGHGFVCGHDCLRCRVNVKIPRGEGATEIKNYPLPDVKFEKEPTHFEESE